MQLLLSGVAGGGLGFALQLLDEGRQGLGIDAILAEAHANAQRRRVEIRVEELGYLQQSLERLASCVHLVIHRLGHAAAQTPTICKHIFFSIIRHSTV